MISRFPRVFFGDVLKLKPERNLRVDGANAPGRA